MARTKNTLINYFNLMLTTVLSSVIGLFVTPIVVGILGQREFGLFRVSWDWIGLLAILELGLSDALLSLLSFSVTSQDDQSSRAALIAGFRAFGRVVLLKFIFGVVIIVGATAIMNVEDADQSTARIVLALLLFNSIFTPLSAIKTLLDVEKKSYVNSRLLTVQVILISAISVILAYAGFGMMGQAVSIALGSLPSNLYLIYYCLRKFKGIYGEVLRGPVSAPVWNTLWRLNWPQFFSSICSKLSLYSDNIIISRILNPSAVTPFFLTQKLIVLAQSQLYGLGGSSWASLLELYHLGYRELFSLRLLELTRLNVSLGFIFLGPIIIFNQAFMALWVGQENFGGHLLTVIASANAVLLSLFALWVWCFTAMGIAGKLLPYYICFTIINLITSIYCTYIFGLAGPVLGTLIASLFVFCWSIPLQMHRYFDIKMTSLYWAVIKPILILLLPFGLLIIAFQNLVPKNWFQLIGSFLFCGITLLCVAWLFVIPTHEKIIWRKRFQNLFGKKNKS